MSKINIAIVGVGNCASALVQGLHYYSNKDCCATDGLARVSIGGYQVSDINVVAAFDVDRRKVGKSLGQAIFTEPNCTTIFCSEVPAGGIDVSMGVVLDGIAEHMRDYDSKYSFLLAETEEPTQEEIVSIPKRSETDVLLNYLPVGSERATHFYADCALAAGVAFINNIPVFIASDPAWGKRFDEANIPVNGDDTKSQLGATITHRTLVDLFKMRGVELDRTYQLNIGGNTDFLNMLDRSRLNSKKRSKTEAIQAVAAARLADENIHVGPSDYVPWQKDNKVCFIRMEGRIFGNSALSLELRLSVEDSPNSAGIVIDAIRCAKLASDRGQGGVLRAPSAYYCKHPPHQYSDDEALRLLQTFITGSKE